MRIVNNISAMNTNRVLSATDNAMGKTLEKLSSGLRINRAADDGAGLAISEKMRAQIRGMKQAIRNAQDGISFIQTAEGALNETHAILNRMRELAVQASNGIYTESDKQKLQEEFTQLYDEIDRIAVTTEFNTKNALRLLCGSIRAVCLSRLDPTPNSLFPDGTNSRHFRPLQGWGCPVLKTPATGIGSGSKYSGIQHVLP